MMIDEIILLLRASVGNTVKITYASAENDMALIVSVDEIAEVQTIDMLEAQYPKTLFRM